MTIRLYHFTSFWHLPSIVKEGALTRGDVPTSFSEGFNAVWFTTEDSAKPGDHGLFSAVNKTRVRIAVDFDLNDKHLYKWTDFAAKHLEPQWAASLDETGGGKAHTWYLYMCAVRLDRAVEVAVKTERGTQYTRVPLPLKLGEFPLDGTHRTQIDDLLDEADDAAITLDEPNHPED